MNDGLSGRSPQGPSLAVAARQPPDTSFPTAQAPSTPPAVATGLWGEGILLARAAWRACPKPPSTQCALRRIARARCPRPRARRWPQPLANPRHVVSPAAQAPSAPPAVATGHWGRGHPALARAARRARPKPPSNQCALRRIARARCPRPQRARRHCMGHWPHCLGGRACRRRGGILPSLARRAGDDPPADLRQAGCIVGAGEKPGEATCRGGIELQLCLANQEFAACLHALCTASLNAFRSASLNAFRSAGLNAFRSAGFNALRPEAVAPEFDAVLQEVLPCRCVHALHSVHLLHSQVQSRLLPDPLEQHLPKLRLLPGEHVEPSTTTGLRREGILPSLRAPAR